MEKTFKFAGVTNISTAVSCDTLTITGSKDINVNSIASGDSSAIQINDAVNISGTLNAKTIVTNDLISEDSTAINVLDGMNVSGTLSADVLDVNEISSSDSSAIQINDDVNISGTLSSNIFFTNEISSSDSSAVTIIDNVTITGNLAVANIATSTISSANSSALTVNDDLNVSGTLSADILDVNEISSGDSSAIQINDAVNIKGSLDIAGNKITNLQDPTTNQDAATKNYVDNQIIAAGSGTVVSITAGTGLTGGTISTTGTIALDFSTVMARVVGDDSTGTDLRVGETIKIAGTSGVSTAVSGDTLTITGPNLSSYATQSYVTSQGYITNSTMTVVGDDSTGTTLNTGETIKIAGVGAISTSVSGDTLTISAASSALGIKFVGDDSSGTNIDDGETIKITGTQNITTAMSGDTLTITGPNLSSYAQKTDTAIIIVGDDSSGTYITVGETLKIAGTSNITTAVSGDTLTITGPNLSSYVTASSSAAFTNKTGNISQWTNDANYLTNSTMTVVGDDSTGTTLNSGETLKIAGGTGITTAVSGDTLTITGINQSTMAFVGDDSTGVTLNSGETLKIAGATGITTAVSGDTLTITGPNLSSYLTAIPKTIDINEISSSDSSAIQVNDSLNVSGTITVGTLVTSNISAPSSTTGTYTISSPTTITLSPASEVLNTAPFTLYARTVAQLAALTASAGAMVYCTNETGGAIPVFFDGTNWRRVTDRAIAS